MTVQVASPLRRSTRTTAAQRAYQRRNQRAAQVGGNGESRGSATATPQPKVATRIPFVATILALLGVGMAVTLLLTTRAAEDSYQLSAARAYNETLMQERAVLQRDVEAGNSAPVLAVRAAELGMIPTGEVARIVVGDDGSVQVVGTPTVAQGVPAAPLNTPNVADRTGPAPLAGSAGAENPRPVPVGGNRAEAPAPVQVPVNPSAQAPVSVVEVAPAPGAPQVPALVPDAAATPVDGNAAVVPPQTEQLTPVTPEDGRR
ncbi:MAG: hypothetical protein WAX14_02230 [Rhodococcus sp. (in: high G+C Gram-positive bacteria)]|uniref:hypothetical protein n=1 Tax=Rhodococcus sp. TaxID=1831 RepID=UPI003BB6359C